MNQPYYYKQNGVFVVLLLITTFVIYSCRKDNSGTQEPADVLLDARTWYEQTFPVKTGNANLKTLNLNTVAETTNGDFSQIIKPDWNHTDVYNRLGKQVIEMPLDSAVKMGFAPQNTATVNGSFNFNRNYSKSSFLVLNDGNGVYEAYIMTLIADSAWVGGDFAKLKRESYKHKADDFSGRLLYFTPKGKLVNGYRYVNGHIAGIVTSSSAITSKVQAASFLTQPVKREVATYCTSSSFTVYVGTVCALGECTIWYDMYTITTCIDEGRNPMDDGGGNGYPSPGGGGGSTTTVEPVPVVVPIDTNPCNQKNAVKAKAENAAIAAKNQLLLNTLNSSGPEKDWEYGTEFRLNSWPTGTYKDIALRTSQQINTYPAKFFWHPDSGYTIGFTHSHPAGTAPSPADLYTMVKSLTNTI